MRTILRTFVAALGLFLAWQFLPADAASPRDHGPAMGPVAARLEADARAGTGPIVRTLASVALQRDPHNRAPFGARTPVTAALARFCAHLAQSLPIGGATRRYRRYFLYLPTAPPGPS